MTKKNTEVAKLIPTTPAAEGAVAIVIPWFGSRGYELLDAPADIELYIPENPELWNWFAEYWGYPREITRGFSIGMPMQKGEQRGGVVGVSPQEPGTIDILFHELLHFVLWRANRQKELFYDRLISMVTPEMKASLPGYYLKASERDRAEECVVRAVMTAIMPDPAYFRYPSTEMVQLLQSHQILSPSGIKRLLPPDDDLSANYMEGFEGRDDYQWEGALRAERAGEAQIPREYGLQLTADEGDGETVTDGWGDTIERVAGAEMNYWHNQPLEVKARQVSHMMAKNEPVGDNKRKYFDGLFAETGDFMETVERATVDMGRGKVPPIWIYYPT